IIAHCDDAFLEAHGSQKGFTALHDLGTVQRLYDAAGPALETSGGSAANTIAGVANYGGKAAYIGKVADDEFGRIFAHDIQSIGVEYTTVPKTGSAPTARSLILVTPDGERTMHTFLGVSPEFESADLDPALIARGNILYLEGYLFDRPEAQAAFYEAARIAREAGKRVALTLSDAFCVDRHRDAFLDIITNGTDLLFANESELLSLTGVADFDTAVAEITPLAPICAITRNKDGSVISVDGEKHAIPSVPVEKVVDSTGAGDLYAAGVLFGFSRNLPVEVCGQLGSLAATETIGQIGPRPRADLRDRAQKIGIAV
ncbi:MAG: adenosine kinase, partial [Pseudomonadota bacterium]